MSHKSQTCNSACEIPSEAVLAMELKDLLTQDAELQREHDVLQIELKIIEHKMDIIIRRHDVLHPQIVNARHFLGAALM